MPSMSTIVCSCGRRFRPGGRKPAGFGLAAEALTEFAPFAPLTNSKLSGLSTVVLGWVQPFQDGPGGVRLVGTPAW